jgi:NAD-dependent SIR2 family protein deacetylase
VIIASVGDDQSLSTGILEFTVMPEKLGAQLYLTSEILLTTTCTSASALKAVSINDVSDSNFYRIFTVQSSGIALWHLSINDRELSVKYVSSSSLGTEGSCVDCILHKRADGSVHELIAVGGEGVAVLSLNLDILRATYKLYDANYLLITAGAGFSADSGLQTYDCGPAEYRAMCDPSKLLENSFDFQQYWLRFTRSYLESLPHVGYELLDQWCKGGRLRNLNRKSNNLSGWWVYTSNVDGFFHRFHSFADSLCEIHGSGLTYRCACGIGYANGESRFGQEWQQWNKKMHSKDECKQTTVEMSLELLTNITNSDQVFLCSHCQCPMRPNVLMFNDNDVNVLDPINIERERYQTWESAVEDNISLNDQKLVILELGCGVAVPAVRQESMDVLNDCAKKIRSTGHSSLCMIRINPKDAKIDNNDDTFEAISVISTAASALKQIDVWINVFNNS